MKATKDAKEHLEKYLAFLYEFRDKYFGNARTVRNVVAEAIKNQNLRLAAMTDSERERGKSNVLTLADVSTFKLDKSDFLFNKKTIGFKSKPQKGSE